MQGGQAFAVAGGQAFGVAYLLDGATHNNPYDNLNLPLPFPDALQEFRLETSSTTAKNGMHSGASVNAVTKSGTNLFHGDLFEFFRHHSFNATDPFARDPVTGRAEGRRLEPQPVRRHVRRTDRDRTGCSSSAPTRAPTARDADRPVRVRADGGDAGRRLHAPSPPPPATAAPRARWAAPFSATGSTRRASARRRSTSPAQLPTTTDPVRPRAVRPEPAAGRAAVHRQGGLAAEPEPLAVRPLHR